MMDRCLFASDAIRGWEKRKLNDAVTRSRPFSAAAAPDIPIWSL